MTKKLVAYIRGNGAASMVNWSFNSLVLKIPWYIKKKKKKSSRN
jgi:hypothetical protein